MSQFITEYPAGATPLDPDELNGLIPTYITLQGELNILERENILEAANWALGKKSLDCLNISFCLDLHKRMFSKVWKWAGKIRKSDKTIGVPKEQIISNLKQLFDNTNHWIQNKTYSFDETCVRFHHQLVAIHPFPNGNGRHARLLTEIIQNVNGVATFTWGNSDLYKESEARTEYIKALKSADQKDYSLLLRFVRN
jgi:Fic-DOC domain mobile mystery protein B